VGLSLVAGPAHAGKVALLLERYLARLDDEPVLIVPNRSDVDRVERDLLARCGCLLGGAIGTFDDLFERLADDDPERRPVATPAQRAVLVRRALANVSLNGLSRSARTGGFADVLLSCTTFGPDPPLGGERVAAELERCVRPGGRVVLVGPEALPDERRSDEPRSAGHQHAPEAQLAHRCIFPHPAPVLPAGRSTEAEQESRGPSIHSRYELGRRHWDGVCRPDDRGLPG
jgi:hypothetical protein